MAPRQPVNDEQPRLLRITARMPLASVASVMGLNEEKVRRILNRLRSGGWADSVMRGMTERRQHRWFLTRRRWTNPTPPITGIPALGRRPAPPDWPSFIHKASFQMTIPNASPWATITRPTLLSRLYISRVDSSPAAARPVAPYESPQYSIGP